MLEAFCSGSPSISQVAFLFIDFKGPCFNSTSVNSFKCRDSSLRRTFPFPRREKMNLAATLPNCLVE